MCGAWQGKADLPKIWSKFKEDGARLSCASTTRSVATVLVPGGLKRYCTIKPLLGWYEEQ